MSSFDPIRVSSLFPNQNSIGKIPCWLRLRPISGQHRGHYVNVIYSEKTIQLYDCVHSHNFSKNSGRSLKFAPFKITAQKDILRGDAPIYRSSLVICGHHLQDVRYRLRIFSDLDRNFEVIHQNLIKAGDVKFVDLASLVDSSQSQIQLFIVQLESEESNLNATLFSWTTLRGMGECHSSLEAVCVDHLTGG